MLSILGRRPASFCDGHSRGHFLKIGGLALGGLSLPQILRAEAVSAPLRRQRSSHKAIIMIYLSGGPSHQDMYDLKMDAPIEIRGSFRPIETNVPGIEICEHMPRLAKMMDKFAIIRSLYGCPDQHASDLCSSGADLFNVDHLVEFSAAQEVYTRAGKCFKGNLDPLKDMLQATPETCGARAMECLRLAHGARYMLSPG